MELLSISLTDIYKHKVWEQPSIFDKILKYSIYCFFKYKFGSLERSELISTTGLFYIHEAGNLDVHLCLGFAKTILCVSRLSRLMQLNSTRCQKTVCSSAAETFSPLNLSLCRTNVFVLRDAGFRTWHLIYFLVEGSEWQKRNAMLIQIASVRS